jgi:Rod binding domain-containing protein
MLQPVDNSLLPAEVRAGGKHARELYGAALGFEQQLVSQLTQQLQDTTQTEQSSDDDQGSGADAVSNMYRQQLPGMLSDAITRAGGLGLAHGIYTSLARQEGSK